MPRRLPRNHADQDVELMTALLLRRPPEAPRAGGRGGGGGGRDALDNQHAQAFALVGAQAGSSWVKVRRVSFCSSARSRAT